MPLTPHATDLPDGGFAALAHAYAVAEKARIEADRQHHQAELAGRRAGLVAMEAEGRVAAALRERGVRSAEVELAGTTYRVSLCRPCAEAVEWVRIEAVTASEARP